MASIACWRKIGMDARQERPGAYAIDPDAVPRVFDSADLRQLDDRRLGRAVGRGVRPRGEPRDRRGQHDRPGLLGAHHRHRGADAVDGAHHVHPKRPFPVGSVVRLWMRPLGDSTPALLISTSTRPKRSTASLTTASTCVEVAHVGQAGWRRADARPGSPARVASSEAWLTSLSTRSVSGSPANWCDSARPAFRRPR